MDFLNFLESNDINYYDTPSLKKVFSKLGLEFADLAKAIEEEKNKESAEIEVAYEHEIKDLKSVPDEEILSYDKIGVPSLVVKIDSPYKNISKKNLEMVLGDLYPEKWKQKGRLDLLLFRKVFLDLVSSEVDSPQYITSQDSSLNLYNRLKSVSMISPESMVVSKFANEIMKHEIKGIEKSLLSSSEKVLEDFEVNSEIARNYWVLDVFEHINKSIMMQASAKQNNRELKDMIDFYEGKRVNTRYFSIGSSMTKIDFLDQSLTLNLFNSSTVCGYYWSDESLIHVGRPEMLQYSLYLADNMFTLSMVRIRSSDTEKMFLDNYMKLIHEDSKTRIGMGSLFETTCLMMADFKSKSASMPLIDNLVESVKISTQLTEEIVSICLKSDPGTCVKMSSIGKTLILADTIPGKGISKYTQRTNRDNKVNENTIRRLRSMFRQKVILSYIKKHGRVPSLIKVPEDLGAQLEMKAAGGNYLGRMVSEVSRYDEVILGQFLEPGTEMNLQSRIIDKACTKDVYNTENNSEKEVKYYIDNDMLDVFKDPIGINKSLYKSSERIVKVLHRKSFNADAVPKYHLVRLSEKEREQKAAARFYGIASFKLKLWISSIMEMIKRAMKLLPGQMMTMTDDERREIMHNMSERLMKPNSYSLFLDYSGHNTSQRPENTNFILEEIANMYGYYEGSKEFEEFTSLSYVFSNIHIIVEDTWSDYIYYSHGQLGAIEGWLGSLWGIQSQLMLDDMFLQLGIKDYIGTTYSDDSCGVFTQTNLDVMKLNGIVKNIQKFGEDMGLIVKLSQTQVTDGRCSMLKEHYYKGLPIDMSIKRMMSISPNGAKVLNDEIEASKLIDSGYTSSCTRSTDIFLQTILRNMRIIKLLVSSFRKMIDNLNDEELDKRYLSGKHNREIVTKSTLRTMSPTSQDFFLVSPRSRNIEFLQFHRENNYVKDLILIFMYGPYTTYGYGLTPMPDVLISGFSLSNIKRLSYLQGILSYNTNEFLGSLINLSTNATAYIESAFPMVGGRRDTSLLLKTEIEKILLTNVKNPELEKFLTMYSKEDEIDFREKLVISFSSCMSSRIVSKFYESSLYAYVSEVISKIDNAATMKMLLGGKRMMRVISKAWSQNYKLKIKQNKSSLMTYQEIMQERDSRDKKLKSGDVISMVFLKIEEIPLMGKVVHSQYKSMFQPIYKGKTKLTEEGNKLHPPQRTFINRAKFDRDIGIEGMFEHKLIFKAYDLVRYVKWLMMEQEKFSEKMEEDDKMNLIQICDETLKTFTDAKFSDIEENVVCPKSGRYFHRASSGGFNAKTGDLSSNLKTNQFDITGVDQLLSKTGGVDNNLNIQYLMIYVKVCLSILEPDPWKLRTLTLTNDIIPYLKDVSFRLKNIKAIGTLGKLYNITSKSKIQGRGKMYFNYSTFVEREDDIDEKFINHVSTTREHFVEMESSFRAVHSYMIDQMIVSPQLVSDMILKNLVRESSLKEGREKFFDDFYRYYKSLNIIGSETPSRSVIRGLLYEELFKVNSNSKENELWTTEIVRHGYSTNRKESLMRLFILATSLSYRMTESRTGFIKLLVDKQRTISASKQNFEKIRKGSCQFYIKDKRITEMIINSFPTLGYDYGQIHRSASALCDDVSLLEFEQMRLGSYYLEIHEAVTQKKEDVFYGRVDYTELDVEYLDLIDRRGIDSAMKGFETACSLMTTPEKVSSPTLSAVYPSAKGLLSLLKGNKFIGSEDKVIELCGGRGDYHLAMMEEQVKHTTLSREDGYNLAMRIPGMTSKKVRFNCFRQEDYMQYFDHSIILLDISHITDKEDCLSSLIGDAKISKKKIIMRLNGLNKFLNVAILKEMRGYKITACLPELESPGYVYLTIDFGTQVQEKESPISLQMRFGYTRSVLSSALINSVSKVDLNSVISVPPRKTEDQTHEVINDRCLEEMLLEEEPDYVHVNEEMKEKINSLEDFHDNMMTYISNKTYVKYKDKLEVLDFRLISRGDERNVPINLISLNRKIRRMSAEEEAKDFIEVDSKLIKNNNLTIIKGVRGVSSDELVEIISDIASIKYNKKMSIECWKLILTMSRTEKLITSSKLLEGINVKKFSKNIDRTINSSYEIASKAVMAFKTGRIIEGLLCVANMGNLKRKSILDHKDKTTRNNILHYKLYMNRIMMLSNTFYNEPNFVGISNEKFIENWNRRGENSSEMDLTGLESAVKNPELLNDFFATINKEYFSFASSFSTAVEDLTESLYRQERTPKDLGLKPSDFGIEVSQEDLDKNYSLDTIEKIQEEYGDEALFDAWNLEEIGDWADCDD